ncbi:MAG TPA: hypothetical protein VM784_11650 [Actinomycetota bacterium]|nr:hypothetical protein [Actinomycetota bacterium]
MSHGPETGSSRRASSARRVELRTFGLVGVLSDPIVELVRKFSEGDKEELTALLRDEAGHPWAAHSFEDTWEEDQDEARHRGLFDLIWHRRALQKDPFLAAHDFAGFDVLLDAALEVAPDAGAFLASVDGSNPDNPRAADGPEWWNAWHTAAGTNPGGWLDNDEVKELCNLWWKVATPEVEEACLSLLGATYTHPGCWTLLSDLGGFFAQCSSEGRVVIAELDA